MCDVYQMLADALRERDVLKARIDKLEEELTQNDDDAYRRFCEQESVRSPVGMYVSPPHGSSPEEIQARSVVRPFPILSEPPTRQPEVNPNGPTA